MLSLGGKKGFSEATNYWCLFSKKLETQDSNRRGFTELLRVAPDGTLMFLRKGREVEVIERLIARMAESDQALRDIRNLTLQLP